MAGPNPPPFAANLERRAGLCIIAPKAVHMGLTRLGLARIREGERGVARAVLTAKR